MSDIGEIRESLTKLQYPTENELIDILLFVNNQQQTIAKLTKEVERWENELNLQIGWLNVERKKNAKLTKEVEVIENQSEETIEILGRDYTKRKNKLIEENTKLKEGLNDIKSQLFDVNNCDTILTSAIEQILKNK